MLHWHMKRQGVEEGGEIERGRSVEAWNGERIVLITGCRQHGVIWPEMDVRLRRTSTGSWLQEKERHGRHLEGDVVSKGQKEWRGKGKEVCVEPVTGGWRGCVRCCHPLRGERKDAED